MCAMPTAHLICGATGAGKTGYAIALAARTRSVRFSVEQWLVALFGADKPETFNLEWELDRVGRCERQIWAVAEPTLMAGTSVVLDLGLPMADDRDRWRARVAGTIAESKLHYLDVGRQIRRERVLERNRFRTSSDPFAISETLFDRMDARFEPPTDDELYGAMIFCEE
jgi:predicted kinase